MGVYARPLAFVRVVCHCQAYTKSENIRTIRVLLPLGFGISWGAFL